VLKVGTRFSFDLQFQALQHLIQQHDMEKIREQRGGVGEVVEVRGLIVKCCR